LDRYQIELVPAQSGELSQSAFIERFNHLHREELLDTNDLTTPSEVCYITAA